MKAAHVSVALVLSLVAVCGLQAQPGSPKGSGKKAKSESEVALDKFFDLVEDKAAKPSQARFQQVAAAGFDFIGRYPKSPRVLNAVKALGMFGTTIPEKTHKEMRTAWTAYLRYEILNQKYNDKLDDDARAAIAAVDSTLAEFELREMPRRDNLVAFREKVDALGQMPASGRFLPDAERSYALVMERIDPKGFGSHLKQLTEHANADVAKMGREMLNIFEVSRAPFALKFTALDGRECDFEKLRGKVVALVFWSASNRQSTQLFSTLKETYSAVAKKGFEVVTVSYDKAEDRGSLEKFVKDNKVAWPVYFDGKGSENEFGQKLNVARAPAVVLFDKTGMLANAGVQANQVGNEVRRLLGLKAEVQPAEWIPESSGGRGGGGRRR